MAVLCTVVAASVSALLVHKRLAALGALAKPAGQRALQLEEREEARVAKDKADVLELLLHRKKALTDAVRKRNEAAAAGLKHWL